ncbi:DEAD/DEAH box helicase [Acidithiobacillus ferriphilus]|uniref:DEAD/DEAH box helicase n=1 Tax=Acidithiobacillus ferriphilus TaxID=1689834 RepID=UPI002DB8CDA6|nr:DEAD/DEAH box helicase [Acidithiobacillus ferriphilus]MEB8474047.1 DEAD/DEAH box helicase [Acidithiobacillus ferriphilus]
MAATRPASSRSTFRTYGDLRYVPDERKPQWLLECVEPHVAIRLKQLFPKIPKQSPGPFTLPADLITAADLEWFVSRYPLRLSDADLHQLSADKQGFDQRQAQMERILLPAFESAAITGLREGQVLRRYQYQAVEILRHRKSLLLGDEGGLGKTFVAAAFLCAEPGALPAAVVCDAHMQIQWLEKTTGFTHLRVHCIKKTRPYSLPPADVYVFRISQIMGWADIFATNFFKTVVYDEPQSLRTGTSTAKGASAKVLSEHTEYHLGLTATPIYNYGGEMWSVMRFIDETVLGDYADFMREWTDHTGRITNPKALGSYLREQHALLRRLKSDVGQELPKVSRIIEYVDYDEKAVRSVEDLARALAIKATTGSFTERGSAVRELDIMVRQATGVAKAKAVAQFARLLVEAGESVLLVGWHRAVYEIWNEELKDLSPAMYTGSESASQKNREKDRFLSGETSVLIMSLRSGAGLDGLQHKCSVVVFGELDWSPGIHQQVIWRVDREGQTAPVTVFFLVVEDGSDGPIMEILGLKASEAHQIVDPFTGPEMADRDNSRLHALVQRYLGKHKESKNLQFDFKEHADGNRI